MERHWTMLYVVVLSCAGAAAWQTTITQPQFIPDPLETSWSQHIPDPAAQMPQGWDIEDDGDWEPPLIVNPQPRPTIPNPVYVDPLTAELQAALPFLVTYLALCAATAGLDLSATVFKMQLPATAEKILRALITLFSSPRMMLGVFLGAASASAIHDLMSIVRRISFGLLLLVGSQLLVAFCREFIPSARPTAQRARPDKLPSTAEVQSFPCRESTMAASWAAMLLTLTGHWSWLIICIPVGFSGMYYHTCWAVDALAGCALGLAWVWILDWSIEGGWRSYNLLHVLVGTVVYGVSMRWMAKRKKDRRALHASQNNKVKA